MDSANDVPRWDIHATWKVQEEFQDIENDICNIFTAKPALPRHYVPLVQSTA